MPTHCCVPLCKLHGYVDTAGRKVRKMVFGGVDTVRRRLGFSPRNAHARFLRSGAFVLALRNPLRQPAAEVCTVSLIVNGVICS